MTRSARPANWNKNGFVERTLPLMNSLTEDKVPALARNTTQGQTSGKDKQEPKQKEKEKREEKRNLSQKPYETVII